MEQIIGKLGYVKKQELESSTYEQQANDQLTNFLDSHKEYLPENDKDGLLWGQFRKEFELYKTPSSAKAYKQLFEKIHTDIKGSSGIDIKKVNASKEKLKVASHSGITTTGRNQRQTSNEVPGLRKDMLKGFTDAEVEELLS